MNTELLAALRMALTYVQKVAATSPTNPDRATRQRQAVRDVAKIQRLIAKAEASQVEAA